jgi:phosphatidylserine/phosphatidylglycerophosphate/cardiolipin synthase-like enzyme
MIQFLETTAASAELRKLIVSSRDRLYLISPYLQISKNLKLLIQQVENSNPSISIKIVSRKDKINADDMSFLQNLKNVNVSALDNLHAKCYLNEKAAIITSMNLYQYSQENNWEMGIKIEKDEEPTLYQEIFEYVESILAASEKYQITKVDTPQPKKEDVPSKPQPKPTVKEAQQKASQGYCIRCHATIKFDPMHPLCDNCYSIWAKFSDPEYKEKYCHACGNPVPPKERPITYEKPICYPCFKKIK